MHPSKNRWLDLSILAVAQFMIVLDVSIMNVALPSIRASLGLTLADLQGIVTAYTLAFGGFLLLGGRAADLFGRKRMFLIGIACFTVVSMAIGIIDSAPLMVPLRALQGLAAAFMSPAALSLVLSIFTDARVWDISQFLPSRHFLLEQVFCHLFLPQRRVPIGIFFQDSL